MFKILLN